MKTTSKSKSDAHDYSDYIMIAYVRSNKDTIINGDNSSITSSL